MKIAQSCLQPLWFSRHVKCVMHHRKTMMLLCGFFEKTALKKFYCALIVGGNLYDSIVGKKM